MKRRVVFRLLLCSCVILAAACDEGDGGTGLTNADFLEAGPQGAGWVTLDLVDPTRETPETQDASALPDRTLVTDVFYPAAGGGVDAPLDPAGAPYPLVVFAHGFSGLRTNIGLLAELLASHGYVTATMDFPLTRMGSPGGIFFEDVMNQPGDVRFVIDTLVQYSETAGNLLEGAVDTSRVALIGHSLGAFTVFLAGLHPAERHPLVNAVIIFSGSACRLPTRTFDTPDIPLLLIYGDRDALIFYDESAPLIFEAAGPPRWLVTLIDGTHTGFVHDTAELLDGLPHADSVACGFITDNIPTDVSPEYAAWMAELGGDQTLTDVCTPACSDDAMLERGMSTLRQVELADVAVRAFLSGVFRDDDVALRFLERDFADRNDDVTVQTAP